jgi:predicted MFS family arabinose efflux permease
MALSNVLGGFVVKQAGYPAAFMTLAGVGVLATLFFARFVQEPGGRHRDRPTPARQEAPRGSGSPRQAPA